MLITGLELKNIKSYKKGTFQFAPGVNGICGLNGHGKTTALEAIGYALYDSNPYRPKSNFIRHGEKNGEVTVHLMADDETPVKVRRRVEGALLEVTLPHRTLKGEDAKHWLEENLHGGPGTYAGASGFFEDMVGVSQGTFTSIFSEAEGQRRPRFDRLLKVDEFRKCYTGLKGPMDILDSGIQAMRDELNTIAGRTEELPALREKVAWARNELRRSEKELGHMQNDVARTEKEHKALEVLRKELDAAGKEWKGLEGRMEGLAARMKKAAQDAKRLAGARKAAEESRAAHESYEGLRKERGELETRRKEVAAAAGKLEGARAQLRGAAERAGELEKELAALKEREAGLKELEAKAEEGDKLQEAAAGARARADSLREEVAKLAKRKKDAGTKNLCPAFEGVTCTTVEDFTRYFKDEIGRRNTQIKRLDGEAGEAQKRVKDLAPARRELEGLRAELRRKGDMEKRLDEAGKVKAKLEKEMKALESAGGEEASAGVEKAWEVLARKERELEPGHKAYLEASVLVRSLGDAEKELSGLEEETAKGEKARAELEGRLKDLRGRFDPRVFDRVATELTELREARSALVAGREGMAGRLKDDEARLENLQKLMERRGELEKAVGDEEGLRSFIDFARKAIKEAAGPVASRFVGEISVNAARVYSELMEDHAQNLSWDESYAVTVEDRGARREFRQLSGGEQMGAAIALRLALLKGLGGSDHIFMDEPTQNMDELRRAKLSGIIRRITGFRQVFVITHDDAFGADYAHVIRVVKEGGESRVMEERESVGIGVGAAAAAGDGGEDDGLGDL